MSARAADAYEEYGDHEEYEEYEDYADGDRELEEWDEPGGEARAWRPAREVSGGYQRSLALGIVAMAPLFVAYELGLAADSSLTRNHAELALLRGLAGLGSSLAHVRQGLVLVGVVVALVLCYRRRVALGPSVMRLVFEGIVGAVVLGPTLAFAMRLFGGVPEELFSASAARGVPELAAAARLFGGAAYEELLFRVLVYGGLFVLTRRVALFFGSGARLSVLLSDVVGVLGSSLAFASLHLVGVAHWLGPGGESYSSPVFLWRTLAGILLALLFRWRGPGVAAWTHALFNLALFLGAGVEVLL